MLTEAEAKTKWCPFAQVLGTLKDFGTGEMTAFGPQNRGYAMGGALDNCMCLASKCMAWRWGGYQKVPSTTTKDQDEAHGFCGLAGSYQPQVIP